MADDFDLKKQLEAADKLKGTRQKAKVAGSREEKLGRKNPDSVRQAASDSIGQDKAAGAYTDRQARMKGSGAALEQADQAGAPLSGLQGAALRGKRSAEQKKQDALDELDGEDSKGRLSKYRASARMKRDQKRKKAAEEKETNKAQKEKDAYANNPIGSLTFVGFIMVGVIQDGLPALLDLALGVGWVLGYMLLPLTWGAYLYMIVRRAPKSLRRKLVMRGALLSSVTLIPYVGEIMPEWIATGVGAWMYIYMYQNDMGGIENVSSSAAVVTGGGKK